MCLFTYLSAGDELHTDQVCGNETLKCRNENKVLGVTTDRNFKFTKHSVNIIKNTNGKFNVPLIHFLNIH